MTLMTIIDGDKRIYRDLAREWLIHYVNGFYKMRHYARSGYMYELRGRERRLLHKFGTVK